MNFKKLIAILLIISCLALAFVSCKQDEDIEVGDSTGENNTPEEDDNDTDIEIDIGDHIGGNTPDRDDGTEDDVGTGDDNENGDDVGTGDENGNGSTGGGDNTENDNTENGGNDGGEDNKEDPDPVPPIPEALTFEEYEALSPEDKQAYFYSYANYEDFFAWYNEAKAKYDEENKSPEIGGDGEIDIGDLIGGGSN